MSNFAEPSVGVRQWAQKKGFTLLSVQKGTVLGAALAHSGNWCISRSRDLQNFAGERITVSRSVTIDLVANASVHKEENSYFIIMNRGIYFLCLDLALTIFSSSTAFKDFGYPSKESKNRTTLFRSVDAQFEAPSDFLSRISTYRPKCDKRLEIAYFVSELMMCFINFHEEAHITLGHSDYRHEKNRPSDELLEPNSSLGGMDTAISQYCEIDADRLAKIKMLSKNHIENLILNHAAIGLKERDVLFLCWTSCALISVIIALLNSRLDGRRPIAWKNHPHGIIRAREAMVPSFAQAMSEKNPKSSYFESYLDARHEFQRLARIWPHFDVFEYALDPNDDYVQVIEEYRGDVLFPYQDDYRDIVEKFRLRKIQHAA